MRTTIHHPTRGGFTLVELLIVLVVIAILSSMMTVGSQVDKERVALEQAALELRSTIRKARSLAMREQAEYAITFNITTPTDGRVIRNFLRDDPPGFRGRHWYALIRPVHLFDTRKYKAFDRVPHPSTSRYGSSRANFEDFVRSHYVGPRHYLPRGVRFLALSDLDGGMSGWPAGRTWSTQGAWGRNWHGPVYPVPWFGQLIDSSGSGQYRLLPWGFYEDNGPDVDRGVLENSSVPNWSRGNARVASCWDVGQDPAAFETTPRGDVIHITRGDRMDALLKFHPDGRISFEHEYSAASSADWSEAGVDYDRGWIKYLGGLGTTSRGLEAWRWNSVQESALTGGFHLTLARDVDETDDIYRHGNLYEFDDREDALASILPFVRVFVHEYSGVTELRWGPSRPPVPLDWVASDGTVRTLDEMGASWKAVHPFCRVQQRQKLYSKPDGDTSFPSAYHLLDNDFVSFKPAGMW